MVVRAGKAVQQLPNSRTPTNDASCHESLVLIGTGEEGSMRASIAHGYTKALCRPDNNVGAPLPWRGQHGAGQQVCSHHHLGLGFLCLGNQVLQHPNQPVSMFESLWNGSFGHARGTSITIACRYQEACQHVCTPMYSEAFKRCRSKLHPARLPSNGP